MYIDKPGVWEGKNTESFVQVKDATHQLDHLGDVLSLSVLIKTGCRTTQTLLSPVLLRSATSQGQCRLGRVATEQGGSAAAGVSP